MGAGLRRRGTRNNGSVVGKQMGYRYIAQEETAKINAFCCWDWQSYGASRSPISLNGTVHFPGMERVFADVV